MAAEGILAVPIGEIHTATHDEVLKLIYQSIFSY